ncbi:hypothetical protein LY78DRAFT_385972 [Colletotrichum sublineola]|nr:hypothetical protein LY78DRAFT_385972 [Colletotrichum sublineola]
MIHYFQPIESFQAHNAQNNTSRIPQAISQTPRPTPQLPRVQFDVPQTSQATGQVPKETHPSQDKSPGTSQSSQPISDFQAHNQQTKSTREFESPQTILLSETQGRQGTEFPQLPSGPYRFVRDPMMASDSDYPSAIGGPPASGLMAEAGEIDYRQILNLREHRLKMRRLTQAMGVFPEQHRLGHVQEFLTICSTSNPDLSVNDYVRSCMEEGDPLAPGQQR